MEEEILTPRTSRLRSTLLFLSGLLLGLVIMTGLCGIYIYNRYYTLSIASISSVDNGAESMLSQDVLEKLQSIQQLIGYYYLFDVDEEEVEDSIYHGFVDGLGDAYSTYYSAEELASVLESTEGTYQGIGAYIGYDSEKDYCYISSVMDGSPALEAGLQSGDYIVAVDGEDMYKVSTSLIVTYIKGEEGTTVTLTIYRDGASEYEDIVVERRKIETPTVTYSMDDNHIATIVISEFDEVTSSQFAEKLAEAKEDGMEALIIDLRDNPGGSLSVVVEIAGYVVPSGLIVYTETRSGDRQDYNNSNTDEVDVPLVVLVNGNSASASEILAGAIKDYGKGTIMGTTTFGKGIVQKIFPFSDGSALKLTISNYYTPAGNNIHGIGIEPDVEVEFDSDAYAEDGTDNQHEAATAYLLEQIK